LISISCIGRDGRYFFGIFNGTGGTVFFIFRDGRDGIKILLSIFRDGIFYFSGRAVRDKSFAFDFSGRAGRDFLFFGMGGTG
jgi:hypothetical protein